MLGPAKARNSTFSTALKRADGHRLRPQTDATDVSLSHEVDKASGDDKLNAHFVWLSGDVGKTEDYLKLAKNSLSFSTPVGICLDGATGPNGYGLNDQVDVTVLLARTVR